MAASANYPYPVLVEGDWAPDIAKVLKTKLQVYFQSRKKSNGGDCVVEFDDLSEKQVVVWFASQQTRCQVLEKETHEVDMQKRGKIHLTVKPLPQADGDWVTTPQLTPGQSDQDTVRKLRKTEKGPQAVLNQEAHSAENDQLMRRLHEDKREDPAQSSAVVLQNLPKNTTCEMLNLLIENFTGLTEETGHFSLEILNETNMAVVIFKTNIDINDFIEKCSRKVLSNNQNIMARQLEMTTSVRVENLPSNISNQFLKLYFESSKNGCGEVTDIEMMSEDDVAIVSFGDSNVLDTILAKTHVIEKTPIYVYPYYKSLGSALYGNKRPVVKMPDPFTFKLDPYIFQFLQKDRRRIAEIKDKMSVHHCNIALLDTDLSNSIKISPTFSGQETSLKKLVKNWKQLASDNLTGILSKYKTINNSVRRRTWEKIQGDFKQHLNQNIVVVPAISNEQVIVAGDSDSVDIFQQEFKSLVDRVTEELEREKQSVTEKVNCDPAKCNLLLSTDLEKCVSTMFPNLTMEYNTSAGDITLYGLPKDVFAAKSKILEELVQIKTKKLDMNPHLIDFLQRLDSNEVSCCLFISNGINAMYDIQDNCVLLIGIKDSFLCAAEEQIKKRLNFKRIKVEDSRVIGMPEWAQLKQKLVTKLNSPMIQVEIKVMTMDEHLEIIISGYSSAVMDVFEMLSDFVTKNTIIQKQVPLKSAGVLQFLMDVRKLDLFHTAPKDLKIRVNVEENGSSVLLSGPQVYVLQMENYLLSEATTVISSFFEIAKPGTKKIFKEKEDMYVSTLMHKFDCILKMIESGNFGDSAKLGRSHYKVQLPRGPLVTVYRGDLCKSEVDVVVNAANEDLQHIGGLAAALLKAAGSTLQTQCNWIVKEQGSLAPGDAVITSAGKLPCSRVIHAVGPRWVGADADTSKKCLRKAIIQSLCLAEAHNLKTIAIPAISSGIFGFPLNLCAEVIVRSIREHCVDSQGGSALKAIHLVNHDEQTVRAISVAVQKILGEFALTGPTPTQPKRLNSGSKINIRSMNCVHEAQTKEGLNVFVLKGGIQDVAVRQGRVNPSQVANAMIDSVCDFVNRKSSTYLQKIRIVIFQPQMFSEFQNSLQKRERSNLPESESFWNKAKNAVTGLFWTDQSKEKKQHFTENHIVFKDQIDPVLFEICGASELIVEKAKSFLQCLILKEHDEKIIYSDDLFQFSEKEEEELTALQKKLQITVELKLKPSGAEAIVRGAAKDVSSAYSKIQEMINNLRVKESRRRDEELLNNLVQWHFEQGAQFIPFDKAVNLDLEKAFTQVKTELLIEWQSKRWRVDFKQNTATDTQGNIINLKRVLKTEGMATDNIPSHWDDMQKSQYKFIQLQQQSQEYQEVVKSITTSENLMRLNKPIKIVKIERLQNMCLWKNYMIKKQQLEDKNPVGTSNEHVLFHGTAQDTLDSINHHGFNRSYAGRNATALGKGTYFAVSASYSAQETYSRTDARGFKYMYRARVLTGVYCRGQPGMVTPPSKSSTNPTDLYDSVVDNEQNPTMFIIFNDIQAYPEYLITFTL
ncbi:protein mono-ADP-ribosyltransferase PARP14 [Rhincodon typus]|uniref:protein mono-ADP-ribosyltransferase PARP14 n=1 Tax=Rhincodon typus TaxID=259920 RepID=UPI002030DB02|nr:protein mono-ADP-ribosyltransferase PARP14 [Rhincodon typus]